MNKAAQELMRIARELLTNGVPEFSNAWKLKNGWYSIVLMNVLDKRGIQQVVERVTGADSGKVMLKRYTRGNIDGYEIFVAEDVIDFYRREGWSEFMRNLKKGFGIGTHAATRRTAKDEPFTDKMLDEIAEYFMEEYGASKDNAYDAAESWLSGRGSTKGVARKLRVKVPYNFGSRLQDRTKATGYFDL